MSKKYKLIDALNAYCISDEGNECNGCPFDNHKDGMYVPLRKLFN